MKDVDKFDIAQYNPTVGKVRLSQTVIDPAIQRGVVEREVNAIGADFVPAAVGFVVVSIRENGDYVLVDGQQRKAGAALADWDEPVNAVFYKGLPREKEAELFRRLNFRTSVSALDAFRIAVVEGRPAEVAVYTVLKEFEVGVRSLTAGKVQFQGVKAAIRIVGQLGGIDDLRWAFNVATQAWGKESDVYYNVHVIDALAFIHRHYRVDNDYPFDTVALIKKLQSEGGGQDSLVGLGKTIRMTRRGVLARRVGDAIMHVYNRGRQGKGSLLPELPK